MQGMKECELGEWGYIQLVLEGFLLWSYVESAWMWQDAVCITVTAFTTTIATASITTSSTIPLLLLVLLLLPLQTPPPPL